jgi:ATP-dependent Clp protease protease subunit
LNTLVLETTEHGDFPIDIYQKLANDRILFICDKIDSHLATDIAATLMLKDAENSGEKITLFINSPGGEIRDVFMIYDVMQMIESPIETVCIGQATDEAVILLMAGEPGMRLATKNCRVSVSQLVSEWMTRANLTDAKKILDLVTSDNKRMMEVIAKCTNKTLKKVTGDFDRRVFMTATQALKYGMIDKIISFSK